MFVPFELIIVIFFLLILIVIMIVAISVLMLVSISLRMSMSMFMCMTMTTFRRMSMYTRWMKLIMYMSVLLFRSSFNNRHQEIFFITKFTIYYWSLIHKSILIIGFASCILLNIWQILIVVILRISTFIFLNKFEIYYYLHKDLQF